MIYLVFLQVLEPFCLLSEQENLEAEELGISQPTSSTTDLIVSQTKLNASPPPSNSSSATTKTCLALAPLQRLKLSLHHSLSLLLLQFQMLSLFFHLLCQTLTLCLSHAWCLSLPTPSQEFFQLKMIHAFYHNLSQNHASLTTVKRRSDLTSLTVLR